MTNKKTNEKSLEKDTENRELPRRKPPGYWKKWENLENALNEIIKNEYNKEKGEIIKRAGEYPTEIELRELKQRALLNAIQRHHGGFMEVRKKMGYESDRNPPGHWKKWENVENALNKIIKNEYKNKKGEVIKNAGEFPTQSELLKINQTALIGAIQRHHGGFSEVRKKMGYESDRNPPGHWKKWENVENALNKIIKNEYKDKKGKIIKKMGEFPTQSQLRKMKQSALTSAIQRHHGGFSEVRKKMGYESVQNPSGHWKIWEHLEKELQKIIKNEYKNEKGEIIKKLGEFPNSMEIKDMGKEILLYAAKNHGGWNNVRELMGFPPESMSKKIEYYRKRGFATEKAVIEVMKDWMDLNGFPYSKDKQTIVAPGRQLECVCGKGNTVGIDVTNSKTIGSVEDKWNVKEYQKYVDQLWVVVVSNKFNENQYKKWNEESPSNVVVIDYRSLEKFLNSFNTGDVNFNIPRQKKIQLDALARCTFENREEIRKKYEADRKQKTIDDYFEE